MKNKTSAKYYGNFLWMTYCAKDKMKISMERKQIKMWEQIKIQKINNK